jgi:hypothetical protein
VSRRALNITVFSTLRTSKTLLLIKPFSLLVCAVCCPLLLLLLLLPLLLTGLAKLAAGVPPATADTPAATATTTAGSAVTETPKPAAKIEEAKKLDGEINGTPAAADANAVDDSTAAAAGTA